MEHLILILSIPSVYLPLTYIYNKSTDRFNSLLLLGEKLAPVPSPSLLSPFLPCALCPLFFLISLSPFLSFLFPIVNKDFAHAR